MPDAAADLTPVPGLEPPGRDSAWIDLASAPRRRPRPQLPADRGRYLVLIGVLGLVAVLAWLRWLAAAPHLPLRLALDGAGRVVVADGLPPGLAVPGGPLLQALQGADGRALAASPALWARSARWTPDDAQQRARQQAALALEGLVGQPQVRALLGDGRALALVPAPRGLAGLGGLSWAACALALALWLAAAATWLSHPGAASAAFAAMAGAQCTQLLLMAAEALPGLGLPAGLPAWDGPLRLAADLVTAAALVQVLVLHPRRLPGAGRTAVVAWAVAAGGAAVMLLTPVPHLWWWTQALALCYGATAAWLARQRPGGTRNPLAQLLQRLVLAGTGTLGLLSLAVALADGGSAASHQLATLGSLAWYAFLASLMILGPFLSRSRPALQELSLLAGAVSVATSLNLMLASAGLGPLAAMAVALAASLGAHAAARPWLMNPLAGPGELSAERMFDSLYRAARELELSPGTASRQLGSLLREVFDPLEVARTGQSVSRVRVTADGSTLVVPVPRPAGAEPSTLLLHGARRGRRLFTQEDQQLCERLLEQLRRAVAYDRAVEHGRSEERARIAQDLHDDIGARLLTLMYKAPSAEIEEYLRHTLQDLKTLTRGLAASSHPFSHAAAEWKADLTQRLAAAGCSLDWSLQFDREITLSVVQWSALTRVVRELVNNIIAHAQASRVGVSLALEQGRLSLQVRDDGIGRAPESWSHGLGLGGVRKRVKLLGGQVRWLPNADRGVRCEVVVLLAPPTP